MYHIGYISTMTEPTPLRRRHDGWTVERQRRFLATLAETGSPTVAAEQAGMSVQGAYRLRLHPGARAFRDAWDLAVRSALRMVESVALERALFGTSAPVVADGEIVGHRRVFSDRLLLRMLDRADRLAADDARVDARSAPGAPAAQDAALARLAAVPLAEPDLPELLPVQTREVERLDAAVPLDVYAEVNEARMDRRIRLLRARRGPQSFQASQPAGLRTPDAGLCAQIAAERAAAQRWLGLPPDKALLASTSIQLPPEGPAGAAPAPRRPAASRRLKPR